MALVLLHTFQTSMEAGLARLRLGAEGIQAFVFDTDGGWDNSGGFGMPVRLMVSEEDAQTAASILTDALDGGFTIEGED